MGRKKALSLLRSTRTFLMWFIAITLFAPQGLSQSWLARAEASPKNKKPTIPSEKGGLKKAKVKNPDKDREKKKNGSLYRLSLGGYFQSGYRMTLNDPKLLRLGDSDGFFVRRARIKIKAELWRFSLNLSIDGAYDRRADPLDVSPSTRKLYVELRDAYLNYSGPFGFFISVGQLKVPFGLHSLRSTADEHFILSPLIAAGEDISFGYQVRPILPGRDIGLAVGLEKAFSKNFGLLISAMLYNGNGPNKFANDSDMPAVSVLAKLDLFSMFKIGGSFLFNPRKVGKLPNLYDERELAFNGFLIFELAGFFLEGEFAAKITQFPTTGQADDFGYGFHTDAGYRIRSLGLEFAVRFELYDPSSVFADDQLIYITPLIGWYYRIWGKNELAIRLSYTLKLEQTDARTLNNDQLNILFQFRY